MQYWKSHNYVSPKDEARFTRQIQGCLKNETIEKAPKGCICCNPILAVRKKDDIGKKVDFRPCLDLRTLNKLIKYIDYPIPKIRDVLDVEQCVLRLTSYGDTFASAFSDVTENICHLNGVECTTVLNVLHSVFRK